MKLPVPSSGFPRAAVPLAAIAIVFASGAVLGIEIALLVAAFFALSFVIGFAWASVQSLSGDSPLTLDEALTLGQPSVEEEQKRAVLRALKDLDYERSVGKISDHDYHELSARYREDAKRLIERVDESLTPARERAEKILAERVVRDQEQVLEREKREATERKAATSDAAEKSDVDDDAPPSSDGHDDRKDEEKDEAKKDEEERT